MKKSFLVVVLLNSVFFSFFIYKYFNRDLYMTRVSLYALKTYNGDLYLGEETEDFFLQKKSELLSAHDTIHDCNFKTQKSVEIGVLFLDIICSEKQAYNDFFSSLFMSYLGYTLKNHGINKISNDSLKEYYVSNLLFENQINSEKAIVLPRYSYVFEDRMNSISKFDLILYFILSFLTLNSFIWHFLKR